MAAAPDPTPSDSDAGPAAPGPELAFVQTPGQARALLDPLRRSILSRLEAPGSASTVAQALDLPRQRVNYHVRELERTGLLRHLEDRRRGNCVERILQATARSYLMDPGLATAEEDRTSDDADERPNPFHEDTLLVAAARTLREAGHQRDEAHRRGRRLPTLCLTTRIRFRSANEQVEFARRMEEALERLVADYHAEEEFGGSEFRVTIGGYPLPESTPNAEVQA